MTFKTRFAPSPTGPLHLGHAYSALVAHDMAIAHGGTFLLRIEDIDQARARLEWETQIFDDLAWLGVRWPEAVMRQSQRQQAYNQALDTLWARGLLFACTCNRRDIFAAAQAPQEGAPLIGPDGIVYPGTCRDLHNATHAQMPRPRNVALRLDMAAAVQALQADQSARPLLEFSETGSGPNGETGQFDVHYDTLAETVGDVVLARRDMGTSYHLSVVLDDAEQGITHVVRGRDLFDATQIHVVLQGLLGLPKPVYHHHALIRDQAGKRLAKRDDARAIRKYRDDGCTPEDIRRMIGL
ncbi:tRNA glutamyl-Q(34) synthetase GluQRS [Tateyamaria sp.]|uniref:tRNA glutamyl-Q(34) synthetase GluQRS n=1 Tax=Tateyamaria sp. TaxID=1929288 RepID=UPI003B213AC6